MDEARRRINLLGSELEKAQAEKEQFRHMYEEIESQLSKLVGLMKHHRL